MVLFTFALHNRGTGGGGGGWGERATGDKKRRKEKITITPPHTVSFKHNSGDSRFY